MTDDRHLRIVARSDSAYDRKLAQLLRVVRNRMIVDATPLHQAHATCDDLARLIDAFAHAHLHALRSDTLTRDALAALSAHATVAATALGEVERAYDRLNDLRDPPAPS